MSTSVNHLDERTRDSAELLEEIMPSAITLDRTVRAAIYLWTQELMAEGIAGEHNHYSPDERAKVAHLDDPEKFWRRAMDEVDSLPIPDVRVTGFFERVFGRAG
jgi:hypothetical protein